MRLFIASPIILDDYTSIKEDFKDIIEAKWVEEENLHLTWVFLGDVKNENPVIEKLKSYREKFRIHTARDQSLQECTEQ